MKKTVFQIGNCFKCGTGIPDSDKVWELCGLCEKCRIEEQQKDEPTWEYWADKCVKTLDDINKSIEVINTTLREVLKK